MSCRYFLKKAPEIIVMKDLATAVVFLMDTISFWVKDGAWILI